MADVRRVLGAAADLAGKLFRRDSDHLGRRPRRGAEDSRVIDHFRREAPPADRERRKLPRFDAADNRVWLGWWLGETNFVCTAARIINISQGGALLSPQDPPPQDRPCWLCLGVPEPVDYVEVAVLEVTANRVGQFAVRLAFREPCPFSFFKAVIEGHAGPAELVPTGGPPQPSPGTGSEPG